MASAYPAALDTLTNPASTDRMNVVGHAAQHADANNAIEAVQATLGTNPQGAAASVSARIAAVEGGGGAISSGSSSVTAGANGGTNADVVGGVKLSSFETLTGNLTIAPTTSVVLIALPGNGEFTLTIPATLTGKGRLLVIANPDGNLAALRSVSVVATGKTVNSGAGLSLAQANARAILFCDGEGGNWHTLLAQ